MTHLAINLNLSDSANERLARRAAERGLDLAAYASALVERAATRPTADEVLAPFRRQVAESGLDDDELDGFLRDQLAARRREAATGRGVGREPA